MAEMYTEIDVKIYIDQSILLKEKFSTDAKVKNLRDTIEFIDEFLIERGNRIEKSHKESKNELKQDTAKSISCRLPTNEQAAPNKTGDSGINIIQLVIKNKFIVRSRDDCLRCKAASHETTSLNRIIDDTKTIISEHKTLDENLLMLQKLKGKQREGLTIPQLHVITPFMIEESELSSREKDILSREQIKFENETSDYDGSSSGIFSDDEIEMNVYLLEQNKCFKNMDDTQWSNDGKGNTNTLCNTNELLFNRLAKNKHSKKNIVKNENFTNDCNEIGNGIYSQNLNSTETPDNKNTPVLRYDLMNNILNNSESVEVNKHNSCLNGSSSDMTKSCLDSTPENITDDLTSSLQGNEFETDKTRNEHCGARFGTHDCPVLSTSIVQTDSFKSKSNVQHSTKTPETISQKSTITDIKQNKNSPFDGHQSCWTVESPHSNRADNINKTCSMLLGDFSENCQNKLDTQESHNVQVISKNDSQTEHLTRTAAELIMEDNKDRTDNLIKKIYAQTIETLDKNKSQTATLFDNFEETTLNGEIGNDQSNDLEPGEIPDDIETHTRTFLTRKDHHSTKYSTNRYRNTDSRMPTRDNTNIYRSSRGIPLHVPPRRIGVKRNVYRWSDYIDENRMLTNNDNSSAEHSDLQPRLYTSQYKSYNFYERRFRRPGLPPTWFKEKYMRYRTRSPIRRPLESTSRQTLIELRRHRRLDDIYFSTGTHDNNDRNQNISGNNSFRRREEDTDDDNEKSHSEKSTKKYTNFKITRSFSARPRFKRPCDELFETSDNNKCSKEETRRNSIQLRNYRSRSESSEITHYTRERERLRSSERKRKRSRERERERSSEHKRKWSIERDRSKLKEHNRKSCSECEKDVSRKRKRKSLSKESKIKLLSCDSDRTISQKEHETKMSSVVTVATSTSTDRTETLDDVQQNNDKINNGVINKEAHLKCFNIIRDYAFKKAVHYSDANWDKYSKRKFLFDDELVQQLERNYNRYLYSANDRKQCTGSGPLPRFVSNELMAKAIIDTWKHPQMIASCDRQFREFDDIIGYVGYNIPCYWCEMIFADGKFVRAFPVLDPIGHRDDTMYCQTDQ